MPTPTDDSETAAELYLVVGHLLRRFRAERALPMAQASALGWLAREGALTTSDLAARERVRPQSMAQTIAEVEGAGLVGRRPDPDDRRKTLVELTPHGRATLDDYRLSRETWLARTIAQQLSAEERALLARAVVLLRRIADA